MYVKLHFAISIITCLAISIIYMFSLGSSFAACFSDLKIDPIDPEISKTITKFNGFL